MVHKRGSISLLVLSISALLLIVGLGALPTSDVAKVFGRGGFWQEDAAHSSNAITGNLMYEGGQATLSVSTFGGSASGGKGYVSSYPSGIECGWACSEVYTPGTVITLTAKGGYFTGWSGDCSGTQPTCTITLDDDKKVTATFGSSQASPTPSTPPSISPTPPPALSLPKLEPKLELCCVDKRYNAEYYIETSGKCESGFEDLTSEVVNSCNDLAIKFRKAVPTPSPVPKPVLPIGQPISSPPEQKPVLPPQPSSSYTLTVESPSIGKIKSADGRINCPGTCTAEYEKGREITLQSTFTMDGAKKFKTVITGEAMQPPVQPPVSKPGTSYFILVEPNQGKVMIDEKTICPPSCRVTYPKDTVLTLKAQAPPGTKASGWGGDIVGTTCFNSGSDICKITMNDNKYVIAAFETVESVPSPQPAPQPITSAPVTGTWRPYSQAIFYDKGGNNIIKPVTRTLEIKPDGTWDFGSKGKWEIKPIESADWKKWGISSYGPTRKIVLNGWNKDKADGPIEESSGVDFIWAIYRTTSASLGPATVQIKFGHSSTAGSYEPQNAKSRRFAADAG